MALAWRGHLLAFLVALHVCFFARVCVCSRLGAEQCLEAQGRSR